MGLGVCCLVDNKITNRNHQYDICRTHRVQFFIHIAQHIPLKSGIAAITISDTTIYDHSMKMECPLCCHRFPSFRDLRVHVNEHYPKDSPVCPVGECRKRFEHPNSVRNHMRSKHSKQWQMMKSIKASGGSAKVSVIWE